MGAVEHSLGAVLPQDVRTRRGEPPASRAPGGGVQGALYNYFKSGGKTAVIQIPVGCGKSGIAAIAPFGIAKGRVLVVSPNLTIKDGIFESLDVTNKQEVLLEEAEHSHGRGHDRGAFRDHAQHRQHVGVREEPLRRVERAPLSTNPEKWLKQFPRDFFDMIIVDEARRSPAESWQRVTRALPRMRRSST
jgi:superfamily II DNA or RNA helicase